MSDDIFSPNWADTVSINNATSATAAVMLPDQSTQLLLTNTSATATVNVMVTWYYSAGETMTGIAPTVTTGVPILPQSQIRIGVQWGHKVIRAIAGAADGALIVTSGRGV
jgi:hypothetical protein